MITILTVLCLFMVVGLTPRLLQIWLVGVSNGTGTDLNAIDYYIWVICVTFLVCKSIGML
jgi:hypothetical protein